MASKETKYCPQHGYPLPCSKCGMGEREAGRKEVIDWINKHALSFSNGNYSREFREKDWQAQLKEWGIYG